MVSIPHRCPGAGGWGLVLLLLTLYPISPTACGGRFPQRLDSREHSGCSSPFLPSYPCPMCVAPKESQRLGVPWVLGGLEVAGTLWDPLSQGWHQSGTMCREEGWSMA